MAHHSIIYEEVDELLVKGSIEPLTGGAGFTQIYLLMLSTLVAYVPYSVLRSLVTIWAYLL